MFDKSDNEFSTACQLQAVDLKKVYMWVSPLYLSALHIAVDGNHQHNLITTNSHNTHS